MKPERRETNEVIPTQLLKLTAQSSFQATGQERGTQTKPSGLTELNLGRLRQLELVGQSIREWELYKKRALEICRGVLSSL